MQESDEKSQEVKIRMFICDGSRISEQDRKDLIECEGQEAFDRIEMLHMVDAWNARGKCYERAKSYCTSKEIEVPKIGEFIIDKNSELKTYEILSIKNSSIIVPRYYSPFGVCYSWSMFGYSLYEGETICFPERKRYHSRDNKNFNEKIDSGLEIKSASRLLYGALRNNNVAVGTEFKKVFCSHLRINQKIKKSDFDNYKNFRKKLRDCESNNIFARNPLLNKEKRGAAVTIGKFTDHYREKPWGVHLNVYSYIKKRQSSIYVGAFATKKEGYEAAQKAIHDLRDPTIFDHVPDWSNYPEFCPELIEIQKSENEARDLFVKALFIRAAMWTEFLIDIHNFFEK